MKEINLYKYKRDNEIIVSPVKPEVEDFELMYRLIADDKKILLKDGLYALCIDVESKEGWIEVDYIAPSDIEERISRLEDSQQIQDGAIEELADVVSEIVEE